MASISDTSSNTASAKLWRCCRRWKGWTARRLPYRNRSRDKVYLPRRNQKTTTPLLQREQYRNGVWGASNELTGAVSQIQVNCAQWETDARTERNREQLPRIYTVSPKGIVVIGKTSELNNWDKRNSFERFRQELRCPEVLTYDELYERAKFIAEGPAPLDEDTDFDMPFRINQNFNSL